jgi:hypothetical protein
MADRARSRDLAPSALADRATGDDDAPVDDAPGAIAEHAAAFSEDARVRERGTWAVIAFAMTFGALTDAVTGAPVGLAMTLGTSLAILGVLVLARPRRAAWPFLAGAFVLACAFVVRASAALAFLDIAGASALLAAAASFGRGGDPRVTTFRSYAMRATLAPLGAIPDGIRSLTDVPTGSISLRRAGVVRAVRVAILIVPVAALLISLFGSADPVFRRLLRAPLRLDASAWLGHVGQIGVGAVLFATLVAKARKKDAAGQAAQRPLRVAWAGTLEWASLLAVVDALFAIFVAIQFAVFFGGRARVLSEAGLTYAEYARSGFWQLLGAAAIAGCVIAFAWLALPDPPAARRRGTFLGLSLGLIGLVLVVLVSAYQRLTLYEAAYGFTPLRILVHATIISLAALFGCTIVALVRGHASWLPAAAAAIAVVALVGLNALSLDAFIARENLARAAAGAPLDVDALWFLSADAVHPTIEALPRLGDTDRARVVEFLACTRERLGALRDDGWAGANLARASALAELRTLQLPACEIDLATG